MKPRPFGLIRLASYAAGLFIVLAPISTRAQSCWSPGASDLTFAAVSPDKPTDATAAVRLTCQSSSAGYVRYCIGVGSGTPVPGIAPRWLSNYNGAQMAYDLYSDSARTQIIGPPAGAGGGAGSSIYTGSMQLAGNFASMSVNAPIYGRVYGGQSLPASSSYYSQIADTSIAWAFHPARVPDTCTSGAASGSTSFYLGVMATMANGCRISLATDLDFGNTPSLASPRTAASAIVIRCPLQVAWSLTLDDGVNSAVSNRRMKGPLGHLIEYDLFQDPTHMQRWGSTGASGVTGVGAGESNPQSVAVYGLAPRQATPRPGVYSDTVRATLTY